MIGVLETAEERVTELAQSYRQICAGYGRFLAVVAQVDEQQDGLVLGHGGTVSLLRAQLRVTRSMAAGMVREARGLNRCPDTQEAFTAGDISLQHVRHILTGVTAVAHLPGEAGQAEKVLLAVALDQDPGAVRRTVAELRQAVGPVDVEREQQATQERSVCYLSQALNGTWDLAGTLDPESGAMLATALDALSTGYLHTPGPHGECECLGQEHAHELVPLSGAQRRAQALVDLASHALTTGETGAHRSARPHQGAPIPAQASGQTDNQPARSGRWRKVRIGASRRVPQYG